MNVPMNHVAWIMHNATIYQALTTAPVKMAFQAMEVCLAKVKYASL